MTYENVISWLEKNVPLNNYDNFADWYKASEKKVNTPNLFSNPTFNRMMEDRWLSEFGSFDISGAEITPSSEVTPFFRPSAPIPQEPKKPEALVILPKTGQAPTIPKPLLVFPANIPQKEKQSLLTRFKNFILRRKK